MGRILAFVIFAILILHGFYSIVIAALWLLIGYAVNIWKSERHGMIWGHTMYLIAFTGVVITPITITHFLLTEDLDFIPEYNEVQSWMIGYIVWGVVCYCATSCAFILSWFGAFAGWSNWKLNRKIASELHVIFLIVG